MFVTLHTLVLAEEMWYKKNVYAENFPFSTKPSLD